MNHREAYIANLGEKSGFLHRCVRFPHVQLRDDAVEAVRNADIVAYNISVPEHGSFTEQVFDAHGIEPKYVFESYIRRVVMFSQRGKFEQLLAGRRLLLIGSAADDAKEALNRNLKDRLGFNIVGALKIYEYDEIPEIKSQIDRLEFDLALLSAGTNAMMLANYIARVHGKVAFDIGFGMTSLFTGEVFNDAWEEYYGGIENLMKL